MVFFTCNGCGAALKKAAVEKHYQIECRKCEVLSCIDCGKDFHGDDYKLHTTCVTENEKYGGKDFKSAPNKGDVKQAQWMERVRKASENPAVEPKVKQLLKRLNEGLLNNVPRKKPKFKNFLANSLRIHDGRLVEKLWDILNEPTQESETAGNGNPDNDSNRNGTNSDIHDKEQNVTKVQGEKKTKKHNNEKSELLARQTQLDNTKYKRQAGPHEGLGDDSDQSDIQEPAKKKKKKKKFVDETGVSNKSSKAVLQLPENGELLVPSNQNGSMVEKKKKKKKKQKILDDLENNSTNQGFENQKGIDSNSTNTVGEKKKKKKKKNSEDTMISKEGEMQRGKKRKRSKEYVEDTQEPKQMKQHEEEPAETEFLQNSGKFPWESVITQVLKKAHENKISLKKLRKKVLSEYNNFGGDLRIQTEEKLLSTFHKKVLKNPKFVIKHEVVEFAR